MKGFVRFLAWTTAILAAITVLLFLFVLDSWVVPDDDPQLAISVLPTLGPEDRIVMQRGAIPNNGQLARCVDPQNAAKYVVGRVFGTGGETVEITAEHISVSGHAVKARFGCPPMTVINRANGAEVKLGCAVEENFANWTYQVLFHTEYPEGNHLLRVPDGMLYLVSDDRHFHWDSRDFGPVQASTCEHVIFRLWGKSWGDSSHRMNILW